MRLLVRRLCATAPIKWERASTSGKQLLPTGYWEKQEHQNQFVAFLQTQKPLSEVTARDIKRWGGDGLIRYFGLFSRLQECLLQNHSPTPPPPNPREFLLENAPHWGITNIHDAKQWYELKPKNILPTPGAYELLRAYESMEHMLTAILHMPPPLHPPRRLPWTYWDAVPHQRLYMNQVAQELGISHSTRDSWSDIPYEKIDAFPGGRAIIRRYGSLHEALETIYKDTNPPSSNDSKWNIFERKKVPQGFWQDPSHHKLFLEYVAWRYGLECPKDWGRVTHQMVLDCGGRSLYGQYDSLLHALRVHFPEQDWDVSSLLPHKVPDGYWKDEENVKQFLRRVEAYYDIQEPSDWYRISRKQIADLGGMQLLIQYRGLGPLLQRHWQPTKRWEGWEWDLHQFTTRDKRSSQRELFRRVQRLFPEEEVIEDYFDEHLTRVSGATIQFDIFLPQRRTAIEYHGIHHYQDLPAFGNLDLYMRRDAEKAELCKKHQIHLLAVPHFAQWSDHDLYQMIVDQQSATAKE